MEDMQEENTQISEDLPRLEAQIEALQKELEEAQRKTTIMEIHKAADCGNVGMKAMVVKLSGDPKVKFEVDHKMNCEQFCKLVLKLSQNEF